MLLTPRALPESLAPPDWGNESHTDARVADLLLHPGVDFLLGPLLYLSKVQEPTLPVPVR